VAGYLGVPRRVIDVFYGGEAPALWQGLMAGVAVGGTLMAAALLIFAAGVAASVVPQRRRSGAEPVSLTVAWGDVAIRVGAAAWVGPLSVLAIVAAMYVFTVIGFELMQSLPIAAAGGAGH
jgi:cytochrome c oxidase subunit 1